MDIPRNKCGLLSIPNPTAIKAPKRGSDNVPNADPTWPASVGARFAEALTHIAYGLDSTWAHLPCPQYPNCTDQRSPWLPPNVNIR